MYSEDFFSSKLFLGLLCCQKNIINFSHNSEISEMVAMEVTKEINKNVSRLKADIVSHIKAKQ